MRIRVYGVRNQLGIAVSADGVVTPEEQIVVQHH